MRLAIVLLVALAAIATAETRQKRQAQYYPAQQQSTQASPRQYSDYQNQQSQYDQYQGQQQQQAARRPAAQPARAAAPARSTQSRNTQSSREEDEEEEELKPSPLELLLERSTFKCEQKKDGYYADTSVECKAFHYCIGGAKNSFMCAEGTVFHQVHLNCVPADQDICGNSEKYYFVNDYLNKELEQRGPNNTILYADRYYPEGFVLGDPIPAAPANRPSAQDNRQQYDDYQPQPAPRARPVAARQPAAQPAYRQTQPASQPAYRQAQPSAQAGYRQAQPQYATQAAARAQPAARPQAAAQPAYDPYQQYRTQQSTQQQPQQQQQGQNQYYRSAAASTQQAQQYNPYSDDGSSEERGVKYDDE